jgi:putative ATPase
MRFTEIFKPKKFDEIVGQDHLLSDNSLFRQLIQSADFDAIILTGPSGTGKTSIAELIGDYLALPFYRLHAASSGNSEIKKIIDTTRHYGKPAIIFVDEIHRFSKVQQDLLLQVIDEKHGKLIGASTENPYCNLTPALRSRAILFEFKKIDESYFYDIFEKVKQELKSTYDASEVLIDDKDLKKIINLSNGDLRRFLNIIESISLVAQKEDNILYLKLLNEEDSFIFSYSEDEHYDLLSALIKSIRGSDPDAALLWCAKLLKTGISPEEIFRRLLISASEDIGNAFPDALVFVNSAYSAFEKVGMPEGRIIISHTVTFLASCPKSNRAYMAWKNTNDFLKNNNPYPPENIRHGAKSYKYPFDKGEFILQKYMDPNEIFYKPSDVGFEKKISDRLNRLWKGTKKYD